MARISVYPRDLNVGDDDAWIGTESSNRLTRNFTAAAVAEYLNIKGKISISGQMVFKFTEGTTGVGEFTGPADGAALTSIATMEISGTDSSGQDTVAFMEYIVDNDILISQQNDISVFGHFKILSYTLINAVYTLNLVNIGGNGNLILDKHYDFATFTISTRADKSFTFTQLVPAATWNVTHNLSKFPSVSVVNNNNILMYGDTTYIDNNNLTITFSGGFSGKAYLN
mgnify:CR=1 FL=1|tara:strand:- start:121 stop:801 length:681 start_codon:yes stop_codon:yes gene_type:complete